MAESKFYYGGQAVIEGVTMRGKQNLVTAIRRPNGEIGLYPRKLSPLYTGRWRKTPLIRGVIALVESFALGIQTLMYSANIALEEEETGLSGWGIWGIVLASLAFAVGLFFLLPLFITNFFNTHLQNTVVFHLVEGIIRVAIFIAYIKIVTLMGDIKRVFGYHGAEHKVINTYEAGDPLEVEYARKHSTANPRCGTSFLFAVLILAILVFSVIGKPDIIIMALSRIFLLPVIAALGYEFIYFTSRHCKNILMKILLTPGLWLQALTTRQPDDSQLEVALAAFKKVIEKDQPETIAEPVELAEAVQLPAD